MDSPPELEDELGAGVPLMASPLHILIVEDQESMAFAISQKVANLREWFPSARITLCGRWADAAKVIFAEPPPDATLLDLSLPDSTMHETISRVEQIAERTAVVIITGHAREKVMEMLAENDVPVFTKNPSLFSGMALILAIVQRMRSHRRERTDRRMVHMDDIITRLKEMQDATPESR